MESKSDVTDITKNGQSKQLSEKYPQGEFNLEQSQREDRKNKINQSKRGTVLTAPQDVFQRLDLLPRSSSVKIDLNETGEFGMDVPISAEQGEDDLNEQSRSYENAPIFDEKFAEN